MLNKVVLIGRLTKDPELRYTPGGVAVTSFFIAVNRNFANNQGERETDFIPIVVWRAQAENCAKYLNKGRLVAVSGRIQTRSYDTPDGQRRYTWEVVADEVQFLDWGDANAGRISEPAARDNDVYGGDIPGFESIEGEDDELPF